MLKTNVGGIDRILRIVLGAAMILAYFFWSGNGGPWWLLIGIVPLATGLLATCPLYTLLGFNTCPLKS